MEKSKLNTILENHKKWLMNCDGGEKANLSYADLREADLRYADLRGADLRGANLRLANLSYADLREADLRGANLSDADLSYADLRDADLRGADLRGANLSYANLSNAKGLLSIIDFIGQFEKDDKGIIVYKRIGETQYNQPDNWLIEPGSFLTEICNPCRTTECGCGVNFGTMDWVNLHYTNADLWECRINWLDLASVVVPYGSDGKARCERLELIEKLNEGDMA